MAGFTYGWVFRSPNYLVTPGPAATSGFVDATPGASGGGGMEQQNGESRVAFLVRIPCSVYNGSRTTSLILQYGHGLFGSRAEAMDGCAILSDV